MSRTSAIVVAALLAAAALLVAGCGGTDEAAPARLLAPEEFATAISEPGRVTINVHVPDEGSLPDTDLWIPFDAVDVRRDELPSPSTPLAVYCRSGRMSTIAVETLSRLGYDDIVELDGGMVAWERGGRRLLPPRGS